MTDIVDLIFSGKTLEEIMELNKTSDALAILPQNEEEYEELMNLFLTEGII